MVNLKQHDLSMSDFLGHMASLQTKFNSLLPVGKSVTKDLAQRGKFFMVLTLTASNHDLAPVRDKILASATVPTLTDVFARLLRVSSTTGPNTIDSSALVSRSPNNSREQGERGPRSGRPKCNYCHRWGHTREKCYKLHGRPTQQANIAHSAPSG